VWLAVCGLSDWDGTPENEPDGWTRSVPDHRRRSADGAEYMNLSDGPANRPTDA